MPDQSVAAGEVRGADDAALPAEFGDGYLRKFPVANSKYADRGSSGKFITIFPADDAEFETTATALDALLGGRPGPYILSDLGSAGRRGCLVERIDRHFDRGAMSKRYTLAIWRLKRARSG